MVHCSWLKQVNAFLAHAKAKHLKSSDYRAFWRWDLSHRRIMKLDVHHVWVATSPWLDALSFQLIDFSHTQHGGNLRLLFKSSPSHFIKRLSPQKLTESPLLDVKFSKVLIVVFLLLNFSVAGYFLQFCIYAKEQTFTSAYYLILPALIIAIFFTVFMIHCLDQVIKQTR